eukprot:7278948-Pyramimonas_sp.AAC.1
MWADEYLSLLARCGARAPPNIVYTCSSGSRAKGGRSGRKWGTGQGGEKTGRVSGVLSASL